MPSGKTHIRINWIVLLVINILLIIFSQDIQIKYLIFFNICFILTSYFISPDLDINSSVYNRWGIFRWIWYPYKELMKHRKKSHSFIWGPISIILNLIIYAAILLLIAASLDLLVGFTYTFQVLEIIVIITICIIIVCWVHIIADKIN